MVYSNGKCYKKKGNEYRLCENQKKGKYCQKRSDISFCQQIIPCMKENFFKEEKEKNSKECKSNTQGGWFGKNQSQYEKCYFDHQHDHFINTDTGEVKEFCDPRIQQIKSTIEDLFEGAGNWATLAFAEKKLR